MKKKFLSIILSVGIVTSLLTGCGEKKVTEVATAAKNQSQEIYRRPEVKDANDAKQILQKGNKRFTSGNVLDKDIGQDKLKELSAEQKPFATVITCSDSRVSPEILFDQGLGDLFVIRDAGNVLDKMTLGSIEYGAEHLNTPLIVVLGHDHCGAVKATVDKAHVSENLQATVDKINISLKTVEAKKVSKDKIYNAVEDENIKNTACEIENNPIIKELIKSNKVKVVEAKYDLETGEVDFK